MIIQKKISLKEALEHIAYSVCSKDIPEGFDHAEVICDFDSDNHTFIITLLDKEEMRSTN